MDREHLDKWCERGILGVVLAILVFAPLATGAVRPVDFVVVEWLTVFAFFLWLCRLWTHARHRLLWTPICWSILLFLGYALFRYQTATIEYAARQEVIKLLVYGSLFLVILNNLHRQESTRLIAITLIVLGLVISLYAIYQFLTQSNHVWHFIRPDQYKGRGSGTYICPNHLAGFLEMLLPVALSFTFIGRFEQVPKILFGYAAIGILAGIVTTLSRGGFAVTALTLALFFAFLIRRREYRIPALILVALLVSGSIFFFSKSIQGHKRFEKTVESGKPTDDRLHIWKSAALMWKENEWMGVGPGHFDHKYPQYRILYFQLRPRFVHNDCLQLLVEWGIIGLVLVVAAILLLLLGVFKSWKFVQRTQNDLSSKKSNKGAFVFGATLGLMAILFHSAFDFNLQIPANALVATTLAALVTGHLRFATERYWVSLRLPLRLVLAVLLLAGGGYLTGQTWSQTRQAYWLKQAEQAKRHSNAQINFLKRAYEVEPNNFETTYLIGEGLRLNASPEREDQSIRAEEALGWYSRGISLNPYDSYNYIKYGMCLHWLSRHYEAKEYFDRAMKLDPLSFYTIAHYGWHYFQLGEYREAQHYFQRSQGLMPNEIATAYLQRIREKLKDNPE